MGSPSFHYTASVEPGTDRNSRYFVNDIDEIRNIDDPNKYFKYFITKNTRWNDRQRFAMNGPLVPSPSSVAFRNTY